MYRTVASILVVCLFVIFAIGSGPKAPSQEEINNANYGPYPENYEEIVKAFYFERLFDPYSAKYRFFNKPIKYWDKSSNKNYFGYVVCGGVNAKNRFGAYVGEQVFFFIINSGKIVLKGEKANATKRCKKLW